MTDRPNFLVIMSDEHGPMWSSAYGHPFVQTPNMERLAESGTTFDADDAIEEAALAYLRDPARQESPWALCVGFVAPHFPFIVPEPYFSTYWPEHADLPGNPPGHLETDPGEFANLANDGTHSAVQQRLTGRIMDIWGDPDALDRRIKDSQRSRLMIRDVLGEDATF